MKLRALPGYSALYLDYIDDAPSVRPFLAYRPDRETLLSHATRARSRLLAPAAACGFLEEDATRLLSGERTFRNIHLLGETGTVAVVTVLPPNILGGPLCVLLQCLSAAKLAEELSLSGFRSIPIAWIQPYDELPNSSLSIGFLDTDLRLSTLTLAESPQAMEGLLQAILQIAPAGSDPEVLAALQRACFAGASPPTAAGAFISQILKDWGLVILDPGNPGFRHLADGALAPLGKDPRRMAALLNDRSDRLKNAGYSLPQRGPVGRTTEKAVEDLLVLNSILPVAAIVAGSRDVYTSCLAEPLFHELQQAAPLHWPRVSATLVEARSQKILAKYQLTIADLFAGEREILRITGLEEGERQGAVLFEDLIGEVNAGMQKAAARASDEGLQREMKAASEKILYQLGKLRERFLAASNLRGEAASRQIARVCNLLAPESRPQECRLAALYFLLRYSHAVIRQIYDKIDVWNHQHQLLDLG